jgi:hypothetical protein
MEEKTETKVIPLSLWELRQEEYEAEGWEPYG